MKLLGIELAPVLVPIERRLQTLSVIFYVSMFMILPFVAYFLAIALFFTRYYWISIGYFAWCIYDNYFSKVSTFSFKNLIRQANSLVLFKVYLVILKLFIYYSSALDLV